MTDVRVDQLCFLQGRRFRPDDIVYDWDGPLQPYMTEVGSGAAPRAERRHEPVEPVALSQLKREELVPAAVEAEPGTRRVAPPKAPRPRAPRRSKE